MRDDTGTAKLMLCTVWMQNRSFGLCQRAPNSMKRRGSSQRAFASIGGGGNWKGCDT